MMTPKAPRDHGGGLDGAIAQFGGTRGTWIDLSTGINPVPYPIKDLPPEAWTALPDAAAQKALTDAARAFWTVPDGAAILAAPGASALIARMPALDAQGRVHIPAPTYNEHAAAFEAQGWTQDETSPDAKVIVHPNNPTGHWYSATDLTAPLTVIDESFADVAPEKSLIAHAAQPGRVVLKSFGKFWGLAGLRLGFAIGPQDLISRLTDLTGPWATSGPALHIGAAALADHKWANDTRARLTSDAAQLDGLMQNAGAQVVGGTTLFRLYSVDDAAAWHTRLAQAHILTRIFPYSQHYIRLGLPAPGQWAQLKAAL